jgi:hypothetical protein
MRCDSNTSMGGELQADTKLQRKHEMMMQRKCNTSRTHGIAALAALALLAGAPASARQAEASFGTPAAFVMDASAEGCYNHPGPTIRLSGTLTLGTVAGEVYLQNNAKGTHKSEAESVLLEVVLRSESGEDIEVAKQPPLNGVGGNPYIFVQFTDDDGRNLHRKPILLGRCVQGLNSTSILFALATHGVADVTTEGCRNHQGPYITIDGGLIFGGLKAKLILSNTRKLSSKGAHTNDENTVTVDVVLKPAGDELRFHKQPPLGGAGGNPHLFFQFTDGEGEGYDDSVYLGRCVQNSN